MITNNKEENIKKDQETKEEDEEEPQEEEFYVLRDTLAIMSLLARIDVDGELI